MESLSKSCSSQNHNSPPANSVNPPSGNLNITPPTLPTIWTLPQVPTGGKIIFVPSGGNLQQAINSASPGDIIELARGAVYNFKGPGGGNGGNQGGLYFPDKGQTQRWIIIRTRGFSVPPGTRVSPSDASQMAKIVADDVEDFWIDEGVANHYWLIGIEVLARGEVDRLFDLGSGSSRASDQPHHFILDRMYLHAESDTSAWVKTAVRINGRYMAVVNSYLSGFTYRSKNNKAFESQAISGVNGAGPFKIVNNFLESAGINFIYGGAGSRLNANGTPSADFEIRRNHFHKRPEWEQYSKIGWEGGKWRKPNYVTVKNLLEFKTGERIWISGNVFENNWASHDQHGYSIGLKDGDNSYDAIRDVSIDNNIFKTANYAIAVGTNKNHGTDRVRIWNNLAIDIDKRHGVARGTARGWFLGIGNKGQQRISDMLITRNTSLNIPNYGKGIGVYGGTGNARVEISKNLFNGKLEGDNNCIGASCSGSYFSGGFIFSENDTAEQSKFVNATNDLSGNYRLRSGGAIGVDMDVLNATMGGGIQNVLSGTGMKQQFPNAPVEFSAVVEWR